MKQKVKVAVFPIAGLGSRFLPITKAGPKEMLPIVDKPLIQYVVEEAIAAGINQLVFVTSSSKRAVEDYFDTNYELESRLEEKGNYEALSTVRNLLPKEVSIVYIRQPHPLGLGDAVLRAKDVVKNAPFAVLLADDIIDCQGGSCLKKMADVFDETQKSVIAIEKILLQDSRKYGIVALGNKRDLRTYQIEDIVEKPSPSEAPSAFAVTGRYILTPRIFDFLETLGKGIGGELQLTDAIAQLIQEEPVFAYAFEGKRYDCGSKEGLIEATIHYALKDPALRERIASYFSQEKVKVDLV